VTSFTYVIGEVAIIWEHAQPKNVMNVVIRKSICAYFCSVVFTW